MNPDLFTYKRIPDKPAEYLPTGITQTSFDVLLPEEQCRYEFVGKLALTPETASKNNIFIEQIGQGGVNLWRTGTDNGTDFGVGLVIRDERATGNTTPTLSFYYRRHNRYVPGNTDPDIMGTDFVDTQLSINRTVEPPYTNQQLTPTGLIFWRLLEEYDGPTAESSSSSSEPDSSSSSSEGGRVLNIFGYDVPEDTAFSVLDENTSTTYFELGDYNSNGVRMASNQVLWNIPFWGENTDPLGDYLDVENWYSKDFSLYLRFWDAIESEPGVFVRGNLYEVSVGAARTNHYNN
jgi:hypothetical protein